MRCGTPPAPRCGSNSPTPRARLVIKVRNDASAAQDRDAGREGAGHGLIGMRERAGMLGGHLEAGPDGGRRFPGHRGAAGYRGP